MVKDESMRVMVAEGEFGSHEKQQEAVAGLLASHFGHEVKLAHTDAGAPFIPGFDGYISISHCHTAVAVAICQHPVGIDIESPRYEQMRRVARRFITADALAADADSPTMLATAWCAKEATYKLHRGKHYKTHVEIPFPCENYIFTIKHTPHYTLAIVCARF